MLKTDTLFDKNLKKYLVDDENACFIYLNNFEVEEKWTNDEHYKFPTISLGNSDRVVNRMEELCLLLASENDYLILKDRVDDDYLMYLKNQGFRLPYIIVVEQNNPSLNITESILSSEQTMTALRKLNTENTYLMPFGTSALEEKLSEKVGIPLATPASSICKQVNNKIYSRNLNESVDIRQIPGVNCTSIDELKRGFAHLKKYLKQGDKLVIKDALGVSGKGINMIDSEKKFTQYIQLMQRSLNQNPSKSIQIVIEKWINKQTEINYHFIVSPKGEILFNFVRESIVKNGVHQGHVTPANLTEGQIEQLQNAANKIGSALHKSGYFGVVGVDAVIDKDGFIYPNLEINARFNMSTYQAIIQELFLNNKIAFAKKVNVKLNAWVDFKKVESASEDLLFDRESGTGILITNFATLNAAYQEEDTSYTGRLYFMVIEKRETNLTHIEKQFYKRISSIEEYIDHD